MWSTAAAEEVGMSSLGVARVSELARRYVAAGRYPGTVTVVARRDRVVLFEATSRRLCRPCRLTTAATSGPRHPRGWKDPDAFQKAVRAFIS